MKNRAIWYVKQLLPLTYRTHVTTAEGTPQFVVWRMWFGRCFDIERLNVAP